MRSTCRLFRSYSWAADFLQLTSLFLSSCLSSCTSACLLSFVQLMLLLLIILFGKACSLCIHPCARCWCRKTPETTHHKLNTFVCQAPLLIKRTCRDQWDVQRVYNMVIPGIVSSAPLWPRKWVDGVEAQYFCFKECYYFASIHQPFPLMVMVWAWNPSQLSEAGLTYKNKQQFTVSLTPKA